jgi:hypothetical protein
MWNPAIQLGRSQRWSVSTAILIAPKSTSLILKHGIIMQGRAQYVIFKILDQETFSVINVYAAQTSNESVVLWKAIFFSELSASHYVLAGDFNMSKDVHRTDSVGHKFMGRREVTIWYHMTIYARGCRMHGCLTAIGRPRRIF